MSHKRTNIRKFLMETAEGLTKPHNRTSVTGEGQPGGQPITELNTYHGTGSWPMTSRVEWSSGRNEMGHSELRVFTFNWGLSGMICARSDDLTLSLNRSKHAMN